MSSKFDMFYVDSKESAQEILPVVSPDDVGGKGYNLIKMMAEGLPIPKFVVFGVGYSLDSDLLGKKFIQEQGKLVSFFNGELVSVRSGAKFSMPGMMDTILNVGINNQNKASLSAQFDKEVFSNIKERFVSMFSDVILGTKPNSKIKNKLMELSIAQQYWLCASAVAKSWGNARAIEYRNLHNIPHDLGTAIIVQQMVYGNKDENSCTGVVFSRNPSTGENEIYGEFLTKAQGEDIVAGLVTPQPITEMVAWNSVVYEKLVGLVKNLEVLNKDMQDVEFTVESGKLYVLQTRNGKRTDPAKLKIAMDLFNNNTISFNEMVQQVSASTFASVGVVQVNDKLVKDQDFQGLGAGIGVVIGKVVSSVQEAVNYKDSDYPCVLVVDETTPDHIAGMIAAKAIVTRSGGYTCHAAVVARSLNKPCVVGVENLPVIPTGTLISVCGLTGRIWFGEVPVIKIGRRLQREYVNLLKNQYSMRYVVVSDFEGVQQTGSWVLMNDLVKNEKNMDIAMFKACLVMKEGVLDFRNTNSPNVSMSVDKLWDSEKKQLVQDTDMSKWNKKKELYILPPEGYYEVWAESLKNTSFKLIADVLSIENLIDCKTGMGFAQSNLKGDFIAKVLDLKKRAGEEVYVFVGGANKKTIKPHLLFSEAGLVQAACNSNG